MATCVESRVGTAERGDPQLSLEQALALYRQGQHRSPTFRDLVAGSLSEFGDDAVVLDIGCGRGFDSDRELQESIASRAGRYIGVEPDPEIRAAPHMHEYHACTFEQAPITSGSVHVAYSTFVLEHVQDEVRFWRKVHDVLAPGGIFWGFTADVRHPFAAASRFMGMLRAKDVYLNWLKGKQGTSRYANYPTFYRANSPRRIARHTAAFEGREFIGFHRVGQLRYYFPRGTKWFADCLDCLTLAAGLPGSILVVKLRKAAAEKATAAEEGKYRPDAGLSGPRAAARA